MFKVTLTNASKNISWGGTFESELEANTWLQKQIGKPNRLPERTVPIDSEYNQEDVLEIIQENVLIGQDEQGNDIYELQDVSVRLKAQFTSEIIDISSQVAQQQTNEQAKKFLLESDWLVIRHMGQKALGLQTSLSEQEYLALEQQRQQARDSILGE